MSSLLYFVFIKKTDIFSFSMFSIFITGMPIEWVLKKYMSVCVCVCVFVCVHARTLSCSVVSNSATPWTVALQAPLSMGFPRQEYWSGLPFLLQGIFLTQGLNLGPLHCRQILYHMSHKEYMCVCVCVCVCLY